MINLRPRSSVLAALAVTTLLLGVGFSPANAVVGTRASSAPQAVSTASWGAVASIGVLPTLGTGVLTITYTPVSTTTYKFFTVTNTGTLSLNSASFAVAAVPASTTVTVQSCSTTWNESLDTCSLGTTTTVVSTAASPATSTIVPVLRQASIRLRATLTLITLVSVTATVSISVPRSSVRTGITTTS